MALRCFRSYIDGRKFKFYNDHQALTQPRRKLARWIDELQQYDFEVFHRAGSHLTDADALSRLALKVPCGMVNFTEIWEGYEGLHFVGGMFAAPEMLIPKVYIYHDNPESGGHDGF